MNFEGGREFKRFRPVKVDPNYTHNGVTNKRNKRRDLRSRLTPGKVRNKDSSRTGDHVCPYNNEKELKTRTRR